MDFTIEYEGIKSIKFPGLGVHGKPIIEIELTNGALVECNEVYIDKKNKVHIKGVSYSENLYVG